MVQPEYPPTAIKIYSRRLVVQEFGMDSNKGLGPNNEKDLFIMSYQNLKVLAEYNFIR